MGERKTAFLTTMYNVFKLEGVLKVFSSLLDSRPLKILFILLRNEEIIERLDEFVLYCNI